MAAYKEIVVVFYRGDFFFLSTQSHFYGRAA